MARSARKGAKVVGLGERDKVDVEHEHHIGRRQPKRMCGLSRSSSRSSSSSSSHSPSSHSHSHSKRGPGRAEDEPEEPLAKYRKQSGALQAVHGLEAGRAEEGAGRRRKAVERLAENAAREPARKGGEESPRVVRRVVLNVEQPPVGKGAPQVCKRPQIALQELATVTDDECEANAMTCRRALSGRQPRRLVVLRAKEEPSESGRVAARHAVIQQRVHFRSALPLLPEQRPFGRPRPLLRAHRAALEAGRRALSDDAAA